jgi:hypothetical protein
VTYLGHFPPLLSPSLSLAPPISPSHRTLSTTHKPPPPPKPQITTNHSQTTTHGHRRSTQYFWPLLSSPNLHQFSLSPYSIAFSPNLHNPTFINKILQFLFVLTTARCLYKRVVASGLVFSSFAGVGNFWNLVFIS